MDPGAGSGAATAMGALMFIAVPLLIAGVIALMIFSIVKAYKERKRRNAAIAATVAAHHLGHLPEDPARTTYFSSPPFGIGDNRRARDVVWGTFGGRPFETFAYSYETHTTDSEGKRTTTTHHYQVTWVPLPGPLPTMRLTADNGLLRLAAKMGARDLKVESHEFNQRWKVWFEDERTAHAILTPRMIERFLAADTQGRGFTFEGAALVSYYQGISDLADLPMMASALHNVVDLLPPFLFEQLGGEPEGVGKAIE